MAIERKQLEQKAISRRGAGIPRHILACRAELAAVGNSRPAILGSVVVLARAGRPSRQRTGVFYRELSF